MIARLWHGYTTPQHADSYEALLKPELLPGISEKKGYRGSHLFRRRVGDEVEFITILFWDTMDDLKAVTGPDFETAVIPLERRQFLSRFDAKAVHYDMPASHGISW